MEEIKDISLNYNGEMENGKDVIMNYKISTNNQSKMEVYMSKH